MNIDDFNICFNARVLMKAHTSNAGNVNVLYNNSEVCEGLKYTYIGLNYKGMNIKAQQYFMITETYSEYNCGNLLDFDSNVIDADKPYIIQVVKDRFSYLVNNSLSHLIKK